MNEASARNQGQARLAWALCVVIAVLAIILRPKGSAATYLPSPSIVALLAGMAVGMAPGVRAKLGSAAKTVSKQVIPIAVVFIGFGLDLGPLASGGSILGTLAAVFACMGAGFFGSIVGGRLFGLDPRAAVLLGTGTAVCGNSAVMAVAPTVQADDDDLGLVVGVINLLGIAMLFALPPLGGVLDTDAEAGGALAGLTVHALPQAIATGQAMGSDEAATLFKLIRVAMLVPVSILLAWHFSRKRGAGEVAAQRTGPAIPLFMILFVIAAVLRTVGAVDVELRGSTPLWADAKLIGKAALGVALAAIGIGLDIGKLVRVGPRVLLAGAVGVGAMVGCGLPFVGWLF